MKKIIALILFCLFPLQALGSTLGEIQNKLTELSIQVAELKEQYASRIDMGDFPGFSLLPITFQKIIICESGGRQFRSDGKVFVSPTKDRGIMQINAPIHAKKALTMGWDIDTTEGNLAYGWWLYKKEGLNPWVCARQLGFI